MQNADFFEICGQPHFGVDAARTQRRMNYVLIIGSENYDRLLIVFRNADVPAVF